MNLDTIKENAYKQYLNYQNYCEYNNSGLAYQEYDMVKDEVLKNHKRKITYDSKKMLYGTYIDNNTRLTCKTYEGLQDKIVEYYMKNLDGLYSFTALFHRAIAFNVEHDFLSLATVDKYKADYKKFLKDSPVFCQDIRAITKSDIIRYFNEFMVYKPTAKCLSNVKTVIRLVFGYAKQREEIECLYINSVLGELHYPKRAFAGKKVTTERVFKDEQKDILLSTLGDNSIDLGIKLCFYTGLRVGELCALQVKDYDPINRVLNIVRAETVHGHGTDRVYEDALPKEYKQRQVFLSEKACEVLKELSLRTDKWLFPYQNGHYHTRSFDSRLRRLCKNNQIPIFSMHDIRRTYASHLLDTQGVTESFAQNQLGHSDIKTTREYYYYSSKRNSDYLNMADLSAE